ncbi:TPA: hypothetical protein N0F65_009069 [Lagenidium giganteum]|uniref:Importin N-terminal domain-containing protein n=1 Tax=Lagenidium giganteum TaxID=4803 RepID=A0AAV2YML2_9STRA|nr:TPA: hypothetical protein N0F65_009069 [Lagenidium giganteum]
MEQLRCCAQQLFGGVPGSRGQKEANEWLMRFQQTPEAWSAALGIIQSLQTQRADAATLLVATQIVRLKVARCWTDLSSSEKLLVRQTLLQFLCACCAADQRMDRAIVRLTCATLGAVLVRSVLEWHTWKADLQQMVDASTAARNNEGMTMLLETLSTVPSETAGLVSASTVEEQQELLMTFDQEKMEVATAVKSALVNVPEARLRALLCLESWVVGCVPRVEGFGLNLIDLMKSELLGVLLEALTGMEEEMSMSCSELLADIVSARPADAHAEAFSIGVTSMTTHLVIATMNAFQRSDEAARMTCRCLARLATALALQCGDIAFSPAQVHVPSGGSRSLGSLFLDYMLQCTKCANLDVMEHTLEFWSFFLDQRTQPSGNWARICASVHEDQIMTTLSQVVNSLLQHCKYPQWFIRTEQLSSDDPVVEQIDTTRREIADTILSLFANWPGPPSAYIACVKGISDLMAASMEDVATVEAALYVLEHTIELFEIDSSDSEESEDEASLRCSVDASEGMQLLQCILYEALKVPKHPLIMRGIVRYVQTLCKELVLPGDAYIKAVCGLLDGIHFSTSVCLTARAVLQLSKSISKIIPSSESKEALQRTITAAINFTAAAELSSRGDLFEACGHMFSNCTDEDFNQGCTVLLQRNTTARGVPADVDTGATVYCTSRLIAGIEDRNRAVLVVEQFWPTVLQFVHANQVNIEGKKLVLRVYLNLLPLVGDTHETIWTSIVGFSLDWYGQCLSPECIKCFTAAARCAPSSELVRKMTETASTIFRRNIDLPPPGSPISEQVQHFQHILDHDGEKADTLVEELSNYLDFFVTIQDLYPDCLIHNGCGQSESILWTNVHLCCVILLTGHQDLQEKVADVLVLVFSSKRLPASALLELSTMAAPWIIEASLRLLDSEPLHRVRKLWNMLFELLHSPRVPQALKAVFAGAIQTIIPQSECFADMPRDTVLSIPKNLLQFKSREQFKRYVSQVAGHMKSAHNDC